jgi:hypothetical protein
MEPTLPPSPAAPSHVDVYVRLRPPRGGGGGGGGGGGHAPAGGVTVSHPLGGAGAAEVHVRAGKGKGTGGLVDHTASGHAFSFDGVFPGDASQAQVYDSCVRELVDGALAGVSGAVLAYGQTGAGKTFTMTGADSGTATAAGAGGTQQQGRDGWGLMPRALAHVLSAAAAAPAPGGGLHPRRLPTMTVRMSYLEIYKDRLLDLLAPQQPLAAAAGGGGNGALAAVPRPAAGDDDGSSDCGGDDDSDSDDGAEGNGSRRAARLRLMEDTHGRVYVRGLRTPVVRDEAHALALLAAGDAARAVAEHALNAASSRSHAVLTVYVEQALPPGAAGCGGGAHGSTGSDGSATLLLSKLHLVDLAGSERVKATRSEGGTLVEARYINQSLGLLEQVVLALCSSGGGNGAGSAAGDGDAAGSTPPAVAPRVAFGTGRVAATTTHRHGGREGGAAAATTPVVLGWQDLPPPGAARSSSRSSSSGSGDGASGGDAAPAAHATTQSRHGGGDHRGGGGPPRHIPYRRSKLTFLLKDALGGGCRTRLIAAVWPEAQHAGDTLTTLRFAARMRNVAVRPTYHTLQDGSDDSGGSGALSARAAQRLRDGYEAQLAALRAQLAAAQAQAQQATSAPSVGPTAVGDGGAGPPAAAANTTAVDAINALTPAQRSATLAAVPAFLDAGTPDFMCRLNGFTAGQAFLTLLLARQTLRRATTAAAGAATDSGGVAATPPLPVPVPAESASMSAPPSPQQQQQPHEAAPPTASAAAGEQPVALADTSALDRAIDAAQAREAAFDAWRAPGGGGAALQLELRAAKAALAERKAAHGAAVAQVGAAKARLTDLSARLRALQQAAPAATGDAVADRAVAEGLAREYVGAKAALATAVTAVAEVRADVEHLRTCAAGIACEMEARFTEESAP